jgi:hypothetical protein
VLTSGELEVGFFCVRERDGREEKEEVRRFF